MAVTLPVVINTVIAVVIGFCLQIVAFGHDIWRLLALGQEVDDVNGRHVMISGCDTGFGHLLALRLIQRGVTVYAGCLTKEGLENIEKEAKTTSHSSNLHALALDITSDNSVAAAREFVVTKIASKGLWGLVCNAGTLGPTTPDDFNTIQDFLKVMDVNFNGHVRMTHAFRPLMDEQGGEGGRIIYMCSMVGHSTGPYSAPYTVSKHAAVAYADCLRTELTSTKLKVITICPGAHPTNLMEFESMKRHYSTKWRQLDADVRLKYGGTDVDKLPQKVEQRLEFLKKSVDMLARNNSIPEVVDAYENALFATRPKLTYWVGADVMVTRVFQQLSDQAQLWMTVLARKLLGDPE